MRLLCLTLCTLCFAASPLVAQSDFVRGDCNQDNAVDIGDPVAILGILFSGDPAPACGDACDINDDGALDIADPVNVLNYLFSSGPAPLAPFPDCGADPSMDSLDCTTYDFCVTAEVCDNGIDDDSDGHVSTNKRTH